jgi:hypothetical protein
VNTKYTPSSVHFSWKNYVALDRTPSHPSPSGALYSIVTILSYSAFSSVEKYSLSCFPKFSSRSRVSIVKVDGEGKPRAM